MKLKKLFPLAGMTGIAAVAAPLLGSCANKGTEIVWSDGEDLPVIEVRTDSFKNAETATNAYYDAISGDLTLLTKDIIHSNINSTSFGDISKLSVRTDAANKEAHTVSFTNKIEGKVEGIAITNTFEVKNAEFEIYSIPASTYTDAGIYFAPKLFADVLNVSLEPSAEAINDLMDYVAGLVNDHSWYLTYTTVDAKSSLTWRLDYTNVYEYASTEYFMTLIDFPILSHYFEGVTIGE